VLSQKPIFSAAQSMDLHLRAATQADHAATRQLVHAAFWPEDVETFLDALRSDTCILGEWLAEDGGGTVGHIVFSRAHVETDGGPLPAAMLTPLAVRPDQQRRGIGLRLINHALRALEDRGETLFLVLGHPSYYPKAGFSAAMAAHIVSPWPNNPAFMARCPSALSGRLIMPAVIANAH
jgi:putative acetyltransferase